MKNKFMITISDMHGSRQYTLNQFIKVIAKWLALLIMILLIGGGIFLKILSDKAEKAQEKTALAQEKIKILQDKEKHLQVIINNKEEQLSSMNTHLEEIEEILGLDTDSDSDIENRATNIEHSVKETIKKIEKKALTKPLLKILNQNIPNGYPITYDHISSKFGYRIHPITHKRAFHTGLDLAAKEGTPIYAPADGIVAYARKKGGYGNYILIIHPFGFKTAYGHLSKFNVQEGDYIKKNQCIGYVGNTGRSTGAHLHYEILYLHKWLNPQKFMRWNNQNYLQVINQEKKVNWEGMISYILTSSNP